MAVTGEALALGVAHGLDAGWPSSSRPDIPRARPAVQRRVNPLARAASRRTRERTGASRHTMRPNFT